MEIKAKIFYLSKIKKINKKLRRNENEKQNENFIGAIINYFSDG